MKLFHRSFLFCTLLTAFCAFAQEAPLPPTEPVPAAPASAAAAKEVAVSPSPADAPPLRRLDTETPPSAERSTSSRRSNDHRDPGRLGIFSDAQVETGEVIRGDAVAVFGHLTVDGEVSRDAVSVLGGTTINGRVRRDVVAVLGNLKLGPNAHVDGKIICIGGQIDRDPGAFVGGGIVQQSLGQNFHFGRPLESWWNRALALGRPLAFGAGLAWLWVVTAFTLAFYALLALLFPGGIRRTGDVLLERPVAVIFSALLTMIALPFVFVLLLVTVIGIPVALIVLPTGVILSLLFGKAAVYGLVGRRISNDALHPAAAVLVGGVIFVLLYLVPIAGLGLTFLVSTLGFGCSIVALSGARKKSRPFAASPAAPLPPPTGRFTSHTGFSVTPPPAMPTPVPSAQPFTSEPVVASPSTPFVAFTAPVGPTSSSTPTEPAPFSSNPVPPPAAGWTRSPNPTSPESPRFSVPPVQPTGLAIPNATLPRAAFWIRTGAMIIDVILISVVFGPILGPIGAAPLILPALAAYTTCMWKTRGTTIGGIVCGLRVVRLDDRPLDWPTAIVRALGCFLSLIVAGLGFIWVIFDDERQSWHDKIAGTVVVHAPKGTSLV